MTSNGKQASRARGMASPVSAPAHGPTWGLLASITACAPPVCNVVQPVNAIDSSAAMLIVMRALLRDWSVAMCDPDISRLRDFVEYTPETGILTWKHRDHTHFKSGLLRDANAWNSKYAGKPVGRILAKGYMQTAIFGERLMVHRLAWMLFHGKKIPDGAQIDHINGNKIDNRIENLRLCVPSQNSHNTEKSRDALRGAHFHKATGKWQASIKIHLGTYDTEEEAANAYEKLAKTLQGEFYLPNGKRVNVRGGTKSL
jgi:hypothetical protein